MHPDPTKIEKKNMKIVKLTFSINCIRVTLSSKKAPELFLMGIRSGRKFWILLRIQLSGLFGSGSERNLSWIRHTVFDALKNPICLFSKLAALSPCQSVYTLHFSFGSLSSSSSRLNASVNFAFFIYFIPF